jgi:hypothetical protein
MEDYVIAATPMQSWRLELTGSQSVQFDAQLMSSCMQAMVQCALKNGCLADGQVHLTAACGETLRTHHAATNCVNKGFGLRVKPTW